MSEKNTVPPGLFFSGELPGNIGRLWAHSSSVHYKDDCNRKRLGYFPDLHHLTYEESLDIVLVERRRVPGDLIEFSKMLDGMTNFFHDHPAVLSGYL